MDGAVEPAAALVCGATVTQRRSFDELVAEGRSAPVDGWDFSWFDGRATEERPPWGYAVLASQRLAASSAACDVQTGGGEVFAWMLEHAAERPPVLAAT